MNIKQGVDAILDVTLAAILTLHEVDRGLVEATPGGARARLEENLLEFLDSYPPELRPDDKMLLRLVHQSFVFAENFRKE